MNGGAIGHALGELIQTFQPIVIAGLGAIAYLLRSIRDELRHLNGRLIELEAWRHAHEPQLEQRLSRIEGRCETRHQFRNKETV